MAALSPKTVFALAALLCGCTDLVTYNEECSPVVTGPDEVTGWLAGDVKTIKAEVRVKDNSIGQMVAESYYFAFESLSAKPDLGLENAGAIRSEGVCESREVVKKGPVKRKILREVLPFDDQVVVVSVTHRQLKGILEHSVAALSPTGAANPSGAFLQLYGGTISADCKLPGETLKSDGSRDREGQRITNITINRRDGTTFSIPLNPASDVEKVRVAINSFLLQGNDNFVDLKALDASTALSAGSFNYEIIAQRFKTTYTETKPLPAVPAQRIFLTDCR